MELKPGDMISHIAGRLISLAQISLAGHIDDGQSQSIWSASERGPSSQPDNECSLPSSRHSGSPDTGESESSEIPLYLSHAEVPDTDAELVRTLWQEVQPPHASLSLDEPLRHFIALQVREDAKKATGKDWDLNGDRAYRRAWRPSSTLPYSVSNSDPGDTNGIPPFLCQSFHQIGNKFRKLRGHPVAEVMASIDLDHPYDQPEKNCEVDDHNQDFNSRPYDNRRTRLPVPDGEWGHHHINASAIVLKNSSTQREGKYIAMKDPKIEHLADFWRMVFHESKDIAVIVMFTQTWKAVREKHAQYFPTDLAEPSIILTNQTAEGPCLDIETSGTEQKFGVSEAEHHQGGGTIDPDVENCKSPLGEGPLKTPIKVKIDDADGGGRSTSQSASQKEESDALKADQLHLAQGPYGVDKVTLLECEFNDELQSEIRKLELSIGPWSKIVWHFLFTGWTDNFESRDREPLLELMKLSALKAGPENPRIIHDSVGHTGEFIALDHLLRDLESGELLKATDAKTDPVFETINRMREQCISMLENEIQLHMVYRILRQEVDIKLGKV